jgi:parvulin-like peptidyl-prolyl isomerase
VVFNGPDGYYLLRVEDRRPAGRIPLADVRGEIVAALRYQRLPAERLAWMQTARAKVHLQITDNSLAAAVQGYLAEAPPLGLPAL